MSQNEHHHPETERTLQAYDSDPRLSGDPFLAARIIELRKSRRTIFGWGGTTGFNYSMAAFIVMLLVNIVTMIYVSERTHRDELQKDVISRLSSEYEMEQPLNN